MRIPLPPVRDKAAPDLLVVANPVWEESWRVRHLPRDRFDPESALAHTADGGGSALNTACALARAGWKVAAVGRVGEDREGEAAVSSLSRHGVVPHIAPQAGRRTGVVRLFVEERSLDRAFEAVIPRTAVAPWTDEPQGLMDARLYLLDRLGASSLAWLRARRADPGLPNVLVVNAPPGRSRSSGWFTAGLPLLDIIQVPESMPSAEARPALTAPGLHRPPAFAPLTRQEIAAIRAAGVSWLVRTRGPSGAILHQRVGRDVELPTLASTVVDPTGAGDALAAGLLDAALHGLEADEALERGLDWAARACRHLGARGWLDHEPPTFP